MDLNQAEVAVTTQHLIDTRQEKDNWLQMSDFGDMGEFLCTCSELFAEEETPEYRYEMGGHSGLTHQHGMAVPQLF